MGKARAGGAWGQSLAEGRKERRSQAEGWEKQEVTAGRCVASSLPHDSIFSRIKKKIPTTSEETCPRCR